MRGRCAQARAAVTEVDRRTVLAGGVTLAGAMALKASWPGPAVRATPASRFHESVGLCTHPNWRDTIWGRADWGSAFLQTGVRNLRGKIGKAATGKAALADLRPLFDAGVKMCVTIAENSDAEFDVPATKAAIDFLADHVGAENICGIESANEFSAPSDRPADWVRKLRDFQAWLHDEVRSRRAFDKVPLIAPSIWGRLTTDYRALGNLEPNVDRGNLHYYTGGRRPTRMGMPSQTRELGAGGESTLERAIADARILAPRKPLWMTEFGYSMAGPGADHRNDISETIAARYLLRGLFDVFAQGVEKTFIYSLIDDSDRKRTAYHGLLDGSLRPRPAFNGLRNLMALFRDEPGASARQSPSYALSGSTMALRHYAFSRSDGSLLLALYQDVDSYDRATRRALAVAPVRLRLTVAEPADVELFDPMVSAVPIRKVVQARSVDVPVADALVVVRIAGTASRSTAPSGRTGRP
jgi:hypothetical protein